MENEKIARMRTIEQCIAYFKEHDPESSVSYYCLSQLIKKNKISFTKAGNKSLINLDKLIEYFNRDVEQNAVEEAVIETSLNYGKLRKVEV